MTMDMCVTMQTTFHVHQAMWSDELQTVDMANPLCCPYVQ